MTLDADDKKFIKDQCRKSSHSDGCITIILVLFIICFFKSCGY